MATVTLWILAALLIVVGLVGTVLPALPGTLFVLAGIVLGAWIDDFVRVSVTTVVIVTVIALLAWALDYAAGLLGARRVGASREALIGAALGTVAGLLMGLPRRASRAARLGCDLGRHRARPDREGRSGLRDGRHLPRGAVVLIQAPSQ